MNVPQIVKLSIDNFIIFFIFSSFQEDDNILVIFNL